MNSALVSSSEAVVAFMGPKASAMLVNAFRSGTNSGKQLFKNVAGTTATVAGGTAGWVGGATAGAAVGSVIPIIGT